MKLQRLKVADLSGDPANARKHDERNIGAIVASLKRFGQQKPIVVDSSRVVRAGNGTLEAARLLGWTEIDCVVTDLKGSEATAYAIADNRTAELASWDDDVLAATLNGLLADDADLLAVAGFDEAELAELLDGLDELGGGGSGDLENPYTRKVEAPIYEPKNEKPPINTLVDRQRHDELVAAIQAAELDEETRSFLFDAARRHLVFNYERIADFYAHSPPEVQRLMEDSALVIIDFQKAIELGYVKVSKKLADIYGEEYGDE